MTTTCPSLALLTDLYQLTMVYGYWKAGIHEREAVFHLNFRRWPFKGGFAIAAGLESAVQFLQAMKFSKSDLDYLKSLQLFEPAFLEFLGKFSFSCDLDALEEGTLVFPDEPILRVKGPIWQAQLLESPLLNMINFQTLIATKSARICMAARPDPVIEFGMRRAQGIDGALSASRAAYIGGVAATSDTLAGKLFGIPVRGTHGHSWVMAFDDEMEAFETFAKVMPHHCVLLIDTFDSIKGAKKAVAIAKSLRARGIEMAGVRLDSGDLARLSVEVRKILDDAGFHKAHIMASNELDEHLIRDLKQQGARIDIWGVGTNLVTGKDQPALDGVYKLAAIQDKEGKWCHRLKLSEQTAKVTNPGILQVRRFFDGTFYVGDVIYDELIEMGDPCTGISPLDSNDQREFLNVSYEDLLQPIFRKGRLVYALPKLSAIRERTFHELGRLLPQMERLTNPQPFFIGLEKALYRKKIELIQEMRKR
jgi:nicotinate phosphoribosyltransferase